MACKPGQSRGACVPVIQYDSDGSCAGPSGGTPVQRAPDFVLDVTNPPDLTWRDEDFTPIQADDDGSVFVFDNI